VDPAINLLQAARKEGAVVAAADAMKLPFADNSIDFVYTIGVLHHLPGREAQEAACREVARVLKPGGRMMIHETNPHNPLFRFYMGYMFPILKTIDDGTEHWLETDRWKNVDGLRMAALTHFTFLPDFVPRALMGPFRAFERFLESSARARPFSVHYMVTLEKPCN
jgi:SAM-dependent methyltransferase